jgi:peptidoglycan L-alanyl-D-glutamate endopeptidase CwlK
MRGLEHLHPRARELAQELVKVGAEKFGLNIGIGETLRTVAEQDALYAQGRTTGGSVVTNAKGSSYSSMHQWGVAFDFYRNLKGYEYSDTAFFDKVGAIGKEIGLFWGGDFKSIKDKPHFQLPEFSPDGTAAYLKKTYGTPDKFMKTWEDEEMKRYNTVAELAEDKTLGDNGKIYVKKVTEYIKSGVIQGDGKGAHLDLTVDMIRTLIIAERLAK